MSQTPAKDSWPRQQSKTPSAAHKQLEMFIGKWINEGELFPAEDAPGGKILASDVYEWIPGKFFVLHTAYGRVGDLPGGAVEVIGYDEATETYRTHLFDSQGNASSEELTISDRVCVWQGATTRATSTFSDDGKTQSCLHERTDDGVNWYQAMQVTLLLVD